MIVARIFILCFVLFLAFGCSAQQTLADDPSNTAVVPVEQDASWAVGWWLPRHNQRIELAKTAEIDLLMLGDSITQGWEASGKEVWQKYYADRNAFNLGFSGDRTEHVLWRLQNGAIDGMNPKLVVLLIGTNNTGQLMDRAEHTAAGIARILDELRERLPEARVLLLSIFPRHRWPQYDMRLRNDEINTLIREMADGETVHYLDVSHVFLNDDGTLLLEAMPDELHPNALGYALWAEAMEPTIEALMSK